MEPVAVANLSETNNFQHDIEVEAICGGIGGALGIVVGAPFDMIKVRMQIFPEKYKSSVQCFRDIVQADGIRGLFKGTMSPVMVQGVLNALLFAGKHAASKILFPNEKANQTKPWQEGVSGACGGFVQCAVLVPSDVVKCNMQVDSLSSNGPRYKGMLDCTRQIYRQDGIRSLFKGFWSTACREIPSIGMYFYSYRILKESLTPPGEESPHWAPLIAGGVAGSASWAVVYPLDVIKSHLQIDHPGEQKPKSMLGMVKYLMHKYKTPMVFYQGIVPTILRAIPVNAVTFYFYELSKKKLGL